jgi:hypothetical protein
MNCPYGQRLLYSRQHLKCGHCGRELPERYRLSEDEIEEIKTENRAIAERRAAAKLKEEEELREYRRRWDD